MTVIIEIILSVLFLFGSAFFSAAETALVSLSSQKAKHLALKNPTLTQTMLEWLGKPHELIIVILIGNTFSVVMFAAIVTSLALRIFPAFPASFVDVIAWVAQTAVMVIIGEMTPKFFARLYPEGTSLFVLPLLARLLQLLKPFVSTISRFIEWITPSTTNAPVNQFLTFSLEELRLLLEETQLGQSQTKESLTMMEKAIDLNDKTVQSIMTPLEKMDIVDLDQIEKKLNREFLIDLIIENGHSRTPVKKHGRFVGYIHAHDLLPLILESRHAPMDDMIVPALDVRSDMQVSDLLQRFKLSEIHIGFVRDGNNEPMGMVTLEDVMEEITGEILDEYDVSHDEKEST